MGRDRNRDRVGREKRKNTDSKRACCARGHGRCAVPGRRRLRRGVGRRSISCSSQAHWIVRIRPMTSLGRDHPRSSCREAHASFPPLFDLELVGLQIYITVSTFGVKECGAVLRNCWLHIPDSAVKVLPTPGGPLRSIIIPCPVGEINQIFMGNRNHWHSNTFTLNHIIEAVLVLHLALGECENQLFVILGKDEIPECPVVPLDVLYGTNRKSDWNAVSWVDGSRVQERITYAISCFSKNIL